MKYPILHLIGGIAMFSVFQLSTLHAQQGNVNFDSSCSVSAQSEFNEGLTLLHHMMYEQAQTIFRRTTELDPNCAIAYWGEAMSYIHPLWGERPSNATLSDGRDKLEKAKTLTPISKHERSYIEAIDKFYAQWENMSYSDQLSAFEKGFAKLHNQYPEDVDAAAFYALSQLATAPKSDKEYNVQKKVGRLLEEHLEQYPSHPGLHHYLIHAYDNSKLAARAVEVARSYDTIAPEVPHALHMPSHIFVRQGIWNDVIEWNLRSRQAALEQSPGGTTSMHYAHAADYLIYAYLQSGEDRKALDVVLALNAREGYPSVFAAAYALAAAQVRHPLERKLWKKAATQTPQHQVSIDWTAYPAAESIIYYANGIGAARSGNPQTALEAVKKLRALEFDLKGDNEKYWSGLIKAQRLGVQAWVSYYDNNHQTALSLMGRAADIEDSMDKHPVTPGHVLPARELLGDMYLETEDFDMALTSYKTCLKINPNRYNCLFGAGLAAEKASHGEEARRYYTKLMKLSGTDGNNRSEFSRAQTFTGSNKYK